MFSLCLSHARPAAARRLYYPLAPRALFTRARARRAGTVSKRVSRELFVRTTLYGRYMAARDSCKYITHTTIVICNSCMYRYIVRVLQLAPLGRSGWQPPTYPSFSCTLNAPNAEARGSSTTWS